MSDRLDMAEALVSSAKEQLAKVKKEYEVSLAEKTIKPALQVSIKNLLENLRSALDYCAREICETSSASASPVVNVYFPITRRGAKREDFPSLLEKNLPNVRSRRPDLASLLASFQEFASSDNDWLPDLATLANENKHDQLTPQIRREKRSLRIQSKGVGMVMGEGTRISMGPGTQIRMGDAVIQGGQSFGPGSPPRVSGDATVEETVWVSFEFAAVGKPVVPFLERAIGGVSDVVRSVRSALR